MDKVKVKRFLCSVLAAWIIAAPFCGVSVFADTDEEAENESASESAVSEPETQLEESSVAELDKLAYSGNDLGSTYTLSIITAVVLGGTLSTGGKGSIIGTALASLVICMLRFGLTLCFGISSQNLDLPVGVMLLLVVSGRQLIRIVRHLDN